MAYGRSNFNVVADDDYGNLQAALDAASPALSADNPVVSDARLPVMPSFVQPPFSILTTFQSGHGWSQTGSNGTVADDTSDYLFGGQCLKVTTNGAGGTTAFRNLSLTSTDFSGSATVVWLKIDDVDKIYTIDCYWGDTSLANNYYRVIVDGTVTVGPMLRSGEWFALRVPRSAGTTTGSPDWAAITNMQLRVKDTGEGAAVVRFGGVGLVPLPAAFPNGVVTVTFDDGYVSQFTQGRKKLDTYGYPAVAYIIADYIGTSEEWMTHDNLSQLQNQHGWEISAHSYAHANHDANYHNLTPSQAAEDSRRVKSWLIENGYDGHQHFAWPGGGWNLEVEAEVSRHFETVRSINNTLQQAMPPTTHPSGRLSCFQVLSTTTTAAVNAAIDDAYANGNWLILCFHKVVTTPSSLIEYSTADFGTVVDYLNTKGIPVRTVSQVLSSLP